ncbi:class A beta-lactamase [Scleromatobacter humisilvae]|uniref:Beta-lactamase n=1 Tax=Scleromatobacter humisilvae TaxID=2897159 RepID=A0A9X1YDF7_9BURK|nr:class A beta-lactamase [Scleromatobacter humisilvae]MCK9684134.1 class A beta-lactamase [Scleromatobacter humisilvae]
MDRRHFGRAALALAGAWPVARALGYDKPAHEKLGPEATRRWDEIEASVGGRLGVAVLDTATGELAGHRLDERFPMCSTFKFLAAALVLSRVDAGQERLDRRIVVTRADLLKYAPVASRHVGGAGMTVAELCDAAITVSDNTAANLLLASAGGPAGVTAFARRIGDATTRLDRNEPSLNTAIPGDPRDTSTPRATAQTLRKVLLGDALSEAGRAQLVRWMTANTTGGRRLRAGVPSDWRVADKTGTGDLGSTNDIGVLWPPRRAPLVVVSYLTDCKAPADDREAALAGVARSVTGGTAALRAS